MKKFLALVVVVVLALAIAVPASAAVIKNNYTLKGDYTYSDSDLTTASFLKGVALTWTLDAADSASVDPNTAFKAVLPMTFINGAFDKWGLMSTSDAEAYFQLTSKSIDLANGKSFTNLSLKVSNSKGYGISDDPMGIGQAAPSKNIQISSAITYDNALTLKAHFADGTDLKSPSAVGRIQYDINPNISVGLMGVFNRSNSVKNDTTAEYEISYKETDPSGLTTYDVRKTEYVTKKTETNNFFYTFGLDGKVTLQGANGGVVSAQVVESLTESNKTVTTYNYTPAYDSAKKEMKTSLVTKAETLTSVAKTHNGFGFMVGLNEFKLNDFTFNVNVAYTQAGTRSPNISLPSSTSSLLPASTHWDVSSQLYNFGNDLTKSLFYQNMMMVSAQVKYLKICNGNTIDLSAKNILNMYATPVETDAAGRLARLQNDLAIFDAKFTTANSNVYSLNIMLDSRFTDLTMTGKPSSITVSSFHKNYSYNFATRLYVSADWSKTNGINLNADARYVNAHMEKTFQLIVGAGYNKNLNMSALSNSTLKIENTFTFANSHGNKELGKLTTPWKYINEKFYFVLAGDYNERLNLKLFEAFELRNGRYLSYSYDNNDNRKTTDNTYNIWIQNIAGIEATYKLNSIFTVFGSAAYRFVMPEKSYKTSTPSEKLAEKSSYFYLYVKATATLNANTTVTVAWGDNGVYDNSISKVRYGSGSMSYALAEYTTKMMWDKFAVNFTIKY